MTRTARTNLGLALLLGLLAHVAGGCLPITATDYDRLDAARESLDSAQVAYEALLDAKVIKTREQAAPFRAMRKEAIEVYFDAKAKLDAGDKLGWQFAYDRLNVALGKYLQHVSRTRGNPHASPATGRPPAARDDPFGEGIPPPRVPLDSPAGEEPYL